MQNPTAEQARKIIAQEAAKRGWTVAYLNLTRGSMKLTKDGVGRVDHGGATLRNNCEANLRYAVYACIESGRRV